MAVNVNTVFNAVNQLILKDMGLGLMSPDQYNALAQIINVQLFNKYFAIFQNTQLVTDKSLPFIVKGVLPIDETGKMTYPTDYVNKIAVRAFDQESYDAEMARSKALSIAPDYNLIKQIKVKTIDNDKLGDRMNAGYLAPTRKHPINTFYSTYNQFYPIDLGVCMFEYLKQPDTPIWGYTNAANGLPVYNPATSTNFSWNWNMQNEIIIGIAALFGVSVSEQQLVQNANGLQTQQA
jgi:hypothetical protein